MSTTSHVILKGSERGIRPGAKAVGTANPDKWMEVSVKLRRKNELPEMSDRPKPISYAQLTEKYGAVAGDIEKTAKVLEGYDLKVIDESPDTRTLKVGGTVSDIEKAFSVKLFQYAHETGNYRGRVGTIGVPAELDGIICGVFGLDNRRMAKKRDSARTKLSLNSATAKHRPWFFPADLAVNYSFPDNRGEGQSIGIVEFGGGYFSDDLDQFCGSTGIHPIPKIVPISVNHTPTNKRDGAEGEVMLDVEVVAAICPNATIPVYFSSFDEHGWLSVLDAAIHDQVNKPSVLSISWGFAEDAPGAWSRGALDAINEAFKEAALLGITICVASGDDGSDDQVGDGHAHVDFPSSSPYVLGVGGTTLKIKKGKNVEAAWKDGDGLRSDNGGATGGGVSVHFPRPVWQTSSINSVNHGSIAGRVVPDVAANASANTGYWTVVGGQAGITGGTSASAPLWAALISRMNAELKVKKVGYLSPLLYKTMGDGTPGSEGCSDIIHGNNISAHGGGYTSTVGYDAVTGWGSPLGTKLLAAITPLL